MVTRNAADFTAFSVLLLNPFKAQAGQRLVHALGPWNNGPGQAISVHGQVDFCISNLADLTADGYAVWEALARASKRKTPWPLAFFTLLVGLTLVL
jgi:hypothetical protein